MFDKEMTLEKFFYDNKNGFDTLVWLHKIFNKFFKEQNEAVATYNSLIRLYMDFKKGFQEDQAKKIEKYRTGVCEKIGTKCGKGKGEWWVYCSGCVLGTYIKKEAPRIGIECVFEDETSDKPLGDFHIYVATWDKPDFGTYKMDIEKAFPNKKKLKHERRIFIPVELASNNQDIIINTLADTYNKLKEIIDKNK